MRNPVYIELSCNRAVVGYRDSVKIYYLSKRTMNSNIEYIRSGVYKFVHIRNVWLVHDFEDGSRREYDGEKFARDYSGNRFLADEHSGCIFLIDIL